MPHVIAVGHRSPVGFVGRLVEALLARIGWLTGRVPTGVTPTLSIRRWWH